jgi:hypothetical protein
MPIPSAVRRPVFGAHGRRVIAALCLWEIVALVPRSPVPTISATVRQWPPFGWVLLGLLGHHWFVELEHALEQAVLDMSDESATSV